MAAEPSPIVRAERSDPALRGLLERIRETPDDDAPRGIIADRYDDLGFDSRATFIRLQLAHAKGCPTCGGTGLIRNARRADWWDSCKDCEERRHAISRHFNASDGEWAYHVEAYSGTRLANWSAMCGDPNEAQFVCVDVQPVESCFRRGFVDKIITTAAVLMCKAHEIFSLHPVTDVRLTDIKPKCIIPPPMVPRVKRPATWMFVGEPRELGLWSAFKSAEDANDAMSIRAVGYGRTAAGLYNLDGSLKPKQSPADTDGNDGEAEEPPEGDE